MACGGRAPAASRRRVSSKGWHTPRAGALVRRMRRAVRRGGGGGGGAAGSGGGGGWGGGRGGSEPGWRRRRRRRGRCDRRLRQRRAARLAELIAIRVLSAAPGAGRRHLLARLLPRATARWAVRIRARRAPLTGVKRSASGFGLGWLLRPPAPDEVARVVALVLVEIPLVIFLRPPEVRCGHALGHDR